jgi:hypothetical protein
MAIHVGSLPGWCRARPNWRLANVHPLVDPVPRRGAQQLWALPLADEATCRARLLGVVA